MVDEAKTGSQALGGIAAIRSAAYHAPGAAADYAMNTWPLNPSEGDWDRTLKPLETAMSFITYDGEIKNQHVHFEGDAL